MMQTQFALDLCLVGPKGCGKSATVAKLADLLSYQIEPIVLYQASFDLLIKFSLLKTSFLNLINILNILRLYNLNKKFAGHDI